MIDLGGRSLQVLHTPGHSADSIMLYDEANKILFTGDTFYLGALYAHFDCPEFGRGNIEHYAATMDKLVREIPQDVQLYCSHNDFIAPGSKLRQTAEALHTIRAGQVSGEHGVAIGHTYLEEGKAIAEYPCDGFSIVYRKRQVERMLGGRKTVICEFLGTGMISVMPVPLLSVHPREYSQQGHIRYVPSVCVYRWTCPVPPHKPPLQAL